MKKQEQIVQGFNYAKKLINSIDITGIENCHKLIAVYNNIDVFLNMVLNNEISIVENEILEKDNEVIKQTSKSNNKSKV